MTRLHLRHRDISSSVIDAIATMQDQKPWTLTRSERKPIAEAFFSEVMSFAGISLAPTAEFVRGGRSSRYGSSYRYTPQETTALGLSETPAHFVFNKWRTVDVIAAIRHHVNIILPDTYVDPHDWACSAFYQAKPVSFRSAARNGKIRGVESRDTFSTASWSKLVEGGLVDRNGRLRFPIKDCLYFIEHGDFPPAEEAAPTYTEEVDAQVEDDLAGDAAALEGQDATSFEDQGALSGAAMEAVEAGELAEEATVVVASEVGDGLDALGIVALRKVSRGSVQGGYSMTKPVLVHAIRQALTAEEITAKIESL